MLKVLFKSHGLQSRDIVERGLVLISHQNRRQVAACSPVLGKKTCYSRIAAESHGDERSALQRAAETVASACAACARPRGCAQFCRP